jgi:hypothetical protein
MAIFQGSRPESAFALGVPGFGHQLGQRTFNIAPWARSAARWRDSAPPISGQVLAGGGGGIVSLTLGRARLRTR